MVLKQNAAELQESLHSEITRLCAHGDSYAHEKNYQQALEKYNAAWMLVPSPKNDWEASTWILGALGDTFFLLGRYKSAHHALEYSLTCPNGFGNPFLHLRLGQVCYEQNDMVQAAEHLTRAYMGAGENIFGEQDPKYFEFLKTKIEI